MIKLENPVLKQELKVRTRAAKIIPAISIRCVILALLFFLVLLSGLGKGLLAFILAEAFLIFLLTPGAICSAFISSAGRHELRELVMTRLGSGRILLGKFVGANLYNIIIIMFSALAMFAISLSYKNFHTQKQAGSMLYFWGLVYANLTLLILLLTSAAISFAFSMFFRRSILVSAILAYTLTLLLIVSIIIPGPIIARMNSSRAKTAITKVALYANPLIMTSRSLGRVDIMRTRYMYKLADPIVGRGFDYPDWYYTGIIYFVVSCFLLVPGSILLKRVLL